MKLDVKSISLSTLLFLTCAAGARAQSLYEMQDVESVGRAPRTPRARRGAPASPAAGERARRNGTFERSDDWSSTAYFYLDRPENGLPKLDPAEKRLAGL